MMGGPETGSGLCPKSSNPRISSDEEAEGELHEVKRLAEVKNNPNLLKHRLVSCWSRFGSQVSLERT